jgi:hypothetical protein
MFVHGGSENKRDEGKRKKKEQREATMKIVEQP